MKKLAFLFVGVAATFLLSTFLLAQPPKDRPEQGPPGPPPRQAPPVEMDKMFKEMDKNGDGQLSLDEFKAGMREFHKQRPMRPLPFGHGPQMPLGPGPERPPMDEPQPGHHPGFGPGMPHPGPAPIIIVTDPEMLHRILQGPMGRHHDPRFEGGREHHGERPMHDHPDRGPHGDRGKEFKPFDQGAEQGPPPERERKLEQRKELRERRGAPDGVRPACPPNCDCPKCKATAEKADGK